MWVEPSRAMKKSWSLPILMVMIFLLSSTSGCLGLLQARETIESLRGEPETKSESIKITHFKAFSTLNPEDWESYENVSTFEIDETVSEILVFRKVTVQGSEFIGCLENFTRYVRAELWAPNAGPNDQPAWSIDVCEDLGAATANIAPTPTFETGTWRLEISARGAGIENSAAQDSFRIEITIKRTCIQYPLEDACI
tara:strand:+ start:695 stop:1285 length:591 start_codon:yes stop_codon:yes gene_type:complete